MSPLPPSRQPGYSAKWMRGWRVRNPERARAAYRRFDLAHRTERRAAGRRYKGSHPELGRRYRGRSKSRLLELLGPWCSLCGETDPAVLQVDHKAPLLRNREERFVSYGGASGLLGRLREGRESPFNLQVLCANDHMRKTAMDHARRSKRTIAVRLAGEAP